MWVAFLAAILFLAGAVANLLDATADPAEAPAGFAISLYLFDTWRLLRRHERERYEFVTWLVENRDAVEATGADYGGILITETTEVTEYRAALSFVFTTITAASRLHVVGRESGGRAAFRFTASSLLLGWWGLPWGPIHTVRTVVGNLQGGWTWSVGDLLGALTGEARNTARRSLRAAESGGYARNLVTLTERAAEAARRIVMEQGFPEGSALHVENMGDHQYRVTFDDQPPRDGSDWLGTSRGVLVLVHQRDAPWVQGMTIDYEDGRFVLRGGPQFAG